MSCYCRLIEVKAIAMYKISLSILIKEFAYKADDHYLCRVNYVYQIIQIHK